jgi:DNA-binding transcriptional MerR regulator
VPEEHFSIGDVAARIGLSLRTIRYYEEVGVAVPSGRTKGGHRLYNERDVDHLLLIMKMKPLDFTLDEMRTVIGALDRLQDPATSSEARESAQDALTGYGALVDERLRWLQERLVIAHEFKRQIREVLKNQPKVTGDEIGIPPRADEIIPQRP